MSRGNQRDTDRERAQKRAEKSAKDPKKKKGDPNAGQNLLNKKEKDAEAMRIKQEKALAKKKAEEK